MSFYGRAEVLASICLPLCYDMSNTLLQLDNYLAEIDNNNWELLNNSHKIALVIAKHKLDEFFKENDNQYEEIIKEKAYGLFSY
mgnify:CR=1 FL=1